MAEVKDIFDKWEGAKDGEFTVKGAIDDIKPILSSFNEEIKSLKESGKSTTELQEQFNTFKKSVAGALGVEGENVLDEINKKEAARKAKDDESLTESQKMRLEIDQMKENNQRANDSLVKEKRTNSINSATALIKQELIDNKVLPDSIGDLTELLSGKISLGDDNSTCTIDGKDSKTAVKDFLETRKHYVGTNQNPGGGGDPGGGGNGNLSFEDRLTKNRQGRF